MCGESVKRGYDLAIVLFRSGPANNCRSRSRRVHPPVLRLDPETAQVRSSRKAAAALPSLASASVSDGQGSRTTDAAAGIIGDMAGCRHGPRNARDDAETCRRWTPSGVGTGAATTACRTREADRVAGSSVGSLVPGLSPAKSLGTHILPRRISHPPAHPHVHPTPDTRHRGEARFTVLGFYSSRAWTPTRRACRRDQTTRERDETKRDDTRHGSRPGWLEHRPEFFSFFASRVFRLACRCWRSAILVWPPAGCLVM